MKIEDNFKRNVLVEGRSYGYGFSVLTKVDDYYKTLMPFTSCKDYFNDFVYIENTKNPLSKVYGFEHKYSGVLENNDYCYIGVRAHNHIHGQKYVKFDIIEESLLNNYKNLIKNINTIENKLFKNQDNTQFEDIVDNTLILKVPKYWFSKSYLISFYLLFIRCISNIKRGYNRINTIEKYINPIIDDDLVLYNKSKLILDNGIIEKLSTVEYPTTFLPNNVHNFGIQGALSKITWET